MSHPDKSNAEQCAAVQDVLDHMIDVRDLLSDKVLQAVARDVDGLNYGEGRPTAISLLLARTYMTTATAALTGNEA